MQTGAQGKQGALKKKNKQQYQGKTIRKKFREQSVARTYFQRRACKKQICSAKHAKSAARSGQNIRNNYLSKQ